MVETNTSEPSIEEILASIRKIISDDDEPEGHEAAPEAIAAPHHEEDEVLELTDIVEEVPHQEPHHHDTFHAEHHPEPEPDPIPVTDLPQVQTMNNDQPSEPGHSHDEGIITDRTMQAATGAFAKLSHEADPPERTSGDGRTVEDITRELLKPMLRQWMDQNLPQIVERLVERELRRISRKAEDL